MKLEQILCEDVSIDSSVKTIVDVMTTEIPELYRKLYKLAENYYRNNGELGSGFRFVTGGQKSQWIHSVFVRHLKPSLYNLYKHTKDPALKQFLDSSIGGVTFGSIENFLPSLDKIAKNRGIKSLSGGVSAFNNARAEYYANIEKLELSSDDDENDSLPPPPKAPNAIGQQNNTVEAIVNDVLSRIDRQHAGEIRQILSRSDNKLQVLQRELSKRGLTP